MISAIVLTFNSEASIQRTLSPLKKLACTIYVVDSFSTDRTTEICVENGCHVVQRTFSTYADQRNWSIEKFGETAEWQLHVDADEELDDELIADIQRLDLQNSGCDGFIFVRRIVFMNKIIKFGGISKTWHMRLFRSGRGRVENRMYDQHFICTGPTKILCGSMLDHQEMSLSEWTARHNRWSDFEVRELCALQPEKSDTLKGNRLGNVIEKKRYKKELYYKMPLFSRVFCYFFIRYFFLLGILDGKEGLIFHVLQGFWFRLLVDSKIYEHNLRESSNSAFLRRLGTHPPAME